MMSDQTLKSTAIANFVGGASLMAGVMTVTVMFMGGGAFFLRDDVQTANAVASTTRENPTIAEFREQCFDLGGLMRDVGLPQDRIGLMCWDAHAKKLLKKAKVKAEVAK